MVSKLLIPKKRKRKRKEKLYTSLAKAINCSLLFLFFWVFGGQVSGHILRQFSSARLSLLYLPGP